MLEVEKTGAGLCNEGYDGIVVRKNEKYDFSFWVKILKGKDCRFQVVLEDEKKNELAKGVINVSGTSWTQKTITLVAGMDVDNAKLMLIPLDEGKYGIDMVSLFPQNTFKNRSNGLRADLAQAIADLKPKFVRFPGGCLAHGDGLDNIYDWKGSIGPLEERRPLPNIWRYHQTRGLGYFEFSNFVRILGQNRYP